MHERCGARSVVVVSFDLHERDVGLSVRHITRTTSSPFSSQPQSKVAAGPFSSRGLVSHIYDKRSPDATTPVSHLEKVGNQYP